MAGVAPGLALVTGASGFVGRALCAALAADGRAVRALMRHRAEGPWTETASVDLSREMPAAALDGVDTVFHLAGFAHAAEGPDARAPQHRALTVEGTRRLVDAMLAAGVPRLVYASSVKAMGEGAHRCLDEGSPALPASAYGRARRDAEELIAAACDTSALRAVVLRLPPVYGPSHGGPPPGGNIHRMLRMVARGRFPPPPETGNRRSFVDVRDVARAAIAVSRDPRAAGRTYIVTDEAPHSTRELFALMCIAAGRKVPRWSVPLVALRVAARTGDVLGRLTGRRPPLDSGTLEKLVGSAWYSSRRIETEIGFRPRENLGDALHEMAAELKA